MGLKVRHLKLKIFTTILIPTLFIVTQNCGKPPGLNNLDMASVTSTSNFAWINAYIIQPKCTGCHGAGATWDLSTYAKVMASGTVVPGNPGVSTFYTQVQSGSMPKNLSKLSNQEIAAIYYWIMNGAKNDGPPVTGGPTLPPLTGSYSSLWANVFFPKCFSCHSSGGSAANKPLTNYSEYKSNIGDIINEVNSNQMPKPPYSPLSTAEKNAIQAWKNAGSPNN